MLRPSGATMRQIADIWWRNAERGFNGNRWNKMDEQQSQRLPTATERSAGSCRKN